MERQGIAKVQGKPARGNPVRRRAAAAPSAGHPLANLQRSVGNQAVQRLISSPYIQAKLQVSTPGDRYEREADRVADTVMRMPEPQSDSGATVSNRTQISRIQRKCSECEKEVQRQCSGCEEEDKLQRKAEGGDALQGSHGAQAQIDGLRGGGQPLPEAARAYFEPRFGHDFSGVRLHTDGQAARAAKSINAQAFTVGQDVAFGAGQYSPGTRRGKELLAHELVHVVQQSSATASGSFKVGAAGSAAEHEAATVASNALSGRSGAVQARLRTPIQVARQPTAPTPPAGPATPSRVDLVRVSCVSNTIEFETDAGTYIYGLIECDIEDADYMATVTVVGNDVDFSPPPNAPGAGARFPYRISPGQPNPSTFFPGQTTVHIVTGTLSPTPSPGPRPSPPGPTGPAAQVCSRDLQISPVGKHAYIEAPPFRYGLLSPTCPQHWYDNALTGTSAQIWDNSPDPCGESPTCIDCNPAPGVTDVRKCLRDAFNAYNNPSLYRLSGPNSNTFAGTLARACCAGMVPKPRALGWVPAWDDSPAPARGTGPCPPGPTC